MFDFILFYSKYSPISCKLLEEFPALSEKSVSVDSVPIRKILKKFVVTSVPTLILILNNNIVDRIIGYENVSNWLHLYVYRVNHLTNSTENDEQMFVQEDEPTYNDESVVAEPQNISGSDGKTSLDDLILEESQEEVHITKATPVNLLKMAEEMKKERDNNDTLKKRI